jgi:hypothetical protein
MMWNNKKSAPAKGDRDATHGETKETGGIFNQDRACDPAAWWVRPG